jgi:hypothetical protein
MLNYATKRRKYIMHPAHPTVGVSVGISTRQFECAKPSVRKLCAVVGPKDQPLAALLKNYLFDFMGDDYSFDWNCISLKARGSSLEDLTPQGVDCLILLGHHAAMNDQVVEKIYDFWQSGGSLVAARIAEFAVHGMKEFAGHIFGGEYLNEHLLAPIKVTLPRHAGRHPLVRGIHPFILKSGLQRYDLLPAEGTPIAFGSAADETMPVAWVRARLGRRVFATTLGSPADFRHPLFLRLLSNAIVWTSR